MKLYDKVPFHTRNAWIEFVDCDLNQSLRICTIRWYTKRMARFYIRGLVIRAKRSLVVTGTIQEVGPKGATSILVKFLLCQNDAIKIHGSVKVEQFKATCSTIKCANSAVLSSCTVFNDHKT